MRNSSLKRSDWQRVNKGSHTFTCHTFIHNEPYLPLLPSHRASPHFGRYSFSVPLGGRRLSWTRWLVTNRGGLLARRLSPIPA